MNEFILGFSIISVLNTSNVDIFQHCCLFILDESKFKKNSSHFTKFKILCTVIKDVK